MIPRTYHRPRFNAKIHPEYLRWIRTLPCAVCWQWQIRRLEPSEVAHVGSRGLGQKCSDTETIPLCPHHHRTGPLSVHALGKKFWTYWKLDRHKLIAEYRYRFERRNQDAA